MANSDPNVHVHQAFLTALDGYAADGIYKDSDRRRTVRALSKSVYGTYLCWTFIPAYTLLHGEFGRLLTHDEAANFLEDSETFNTDR